MKRRGRQSRRHLFEHGVFGKKLGGESWIARSEQYRPSQ
jgi:hypothetical protein